MTVNSLRAFWLAVPLLFAANAALGQSTAAFDELMRQSLKEGHGLIFYIDGTQIAGVVLGPPHDGVVEVRNREHDRIVIRLDSIDAIAGR